MNRRKFLAGSAATVVIAGTSVYLLSDKRNFERSDSALNQNKKIGLKADEIKISKLATCLFMLLAIAILFVALLPKIREQYRKPF